ncbi:pyridoxal 5'-phosphate synthase glutaminase subunit PdxT [Alteribacter lacisalsi]|uniref:Pyridoxal 5'-phosphate synthase subunit PdxT n=1 Tax=Alteribacter lacisalsi TaxID=2045244 RepID=A0A2W0H0U2_9BACI|nr:pyridoxal 5'-phosphate synthase glutaminase subunit PdxT [Alteribacter lacisalsi]PYZ95394.1 pyridoxal 5'-phosphate synthase glutaminase subunit PdxT [Alteribacter lacisalsi]
MINIGVLALQGAVREHAAALEAADVNVITVKRTEELNGLDGLVFPGGESTTMRRLIDKYGFFEPLKKFSEQGNPMFGTCAGAILMAKEIVGQDPHLGVMDMTVQRNAFGRQRESFEAPLKVKGIGDDVHGVFIRAPIIVSTGPAAEVISEYDGEIVAAKQGNFLACSYHPELTDDHRMHQYFVEMIRKNRLAA